MEAPDRALLDRWIAQWDDLVEFEVVPVITSAAAVAAVTPRL
jgi:siroheme synthase